MSYPHTRVKLQSLVCDFSCFRPTGLRRSRDRDFQQTLTVGPGHAAYRKPNGAAGGRRARDLCARTCARDGRGGAAVRAVSRSACGVGELKRAVHAGGLSEAGIMTWGLGV